MNEYKVICDNGFEDLFYADSDEKAIEYATWMGDEIEEIYCESVRERLVMGYDENGDEIEIAHIY